MKLKKTRQRAMPETHTMEYVDLQTVPFRSNINLERPAGNWIRQDYPGQNYEAPPASVGGAVASRQTANGLIQGAPKKKVMGAEAAVAGQDLGKLKRVAEQDRTTQQPLIKRKHAVDMVSREATAPRCSQMRISWPGRKGHMLKQHKKRRPHQLILTSLQRPQASELTQLLRHPYSVQSKRIYAHFSKPFEKSSCHKSLTSGKMKQQKLNIHQKDFDT
jgi:hypothetical protein